MLFWKKKTPPLVQSSASAWREQWREIVPPESVSYTHLTLPTNSLV